jgi:hypothetical protein
MELLDTSRHEPCLERKTVFQLEIMVGLTKAEEKECPKLRHSMQSRKVEMNLDVERAYIELAPFLLSLIEGWKLESDSRGQEPPL